MIELEVYVRGLRDLKKVWGLDHELEAIPGFGYKVDSDRDIVYLDLDEPTITFREIRAGLKKPGVDLRFFGGIPTELRARTKTQLLNV
jgi:hypothetical protein